ncbi:MAG: helix-turn-helix domain-containing protein [Aridibacter sp.]
MAEENNEQMFAGFEKQICPVCRSVTSAYLIPADGMNFVESLNALEKRIIEEALDRTNGNQAAAARLLKLEYHSIRYYLKKHHLL